MSEDINDEYEAYAEPIRVEAKADYDLGKRLRTRPIRVETVRVYTDEVAGARLGGDEPIIDGNGLFRGNRSWGIVKDLRDILGQVKRDADYRKTLTEKDDVEEIAELEASIAEGQARAEELQVEAKRLATTLEQSAIDIELKSLPPIVRNSALRKARQELGIKGKPPKEGDAAEAFEREHEAQLLSLAAVSLHDIGEEHKQEGISLQEARGLRDFLPESEYKRLTDKLIELEFQSAIAQAAVDDPDFSQAGS